MSATALETRSLSKRYGRTWALRDCTVALPVGRVAALVGPNGSGKTTLLHLAVGLLEPTGGEVTTCGHTPVQEPKQVLPRVGFVAQDHPLYKGFRVAEMLTLGRELNARWDDALVQARLRRLGIPLDRRVGKLSGGQQAQVALGLALAKRPELLLLDEPVASLDPLARREFLRALAEAAGTGDLTVLLSSHIIGDLEQVCDYLIILSAARVQLAGDIGEIRRDHLVLVGPRSGMAEIAQAHAVVDADQLGREARLLVRARAPLVAPLGWQAREATMEEIVLAYLGQAEFNGDTAAPPAALATAEWSSEEVAR
jgi:ABC-2 type transport system ATP-binding protein